MISVIIPTLNAARTLPATLTALAPGVIAGVIKDLVIVDGGSSDASPVIADEAGATIVRTEPGRGRQLIAGAGAARGDYFLFLHGDTVLEPEWIAEAASFMTDPNCRTKAGVFRFDFDDKRPAARLITFWVGMRCAFLRLPYGDQGLLISRALYERLGGYRPLPLMEDVDLVRRIGGGNLRFFHARAITSAEKYRRDGFQKRAWRNLFLLGRYYLGADPAKLAKDYE